MLKCAYLFIFIIKAGSMAADSGIEKLIRPHFRRMDGYTAATAPETLEGKVDVKLEDIVKLDANENPYGSSPQVKQALGDYNAYGIYPDASQTELRKLLADYSGSGAEHIVAGNGSDEIIDLLLRLLLEPGDEVVSPVPTFDMYRFSTQICGGTFVEVPRNEDYTVSVKAVKSAITEKTKMLFLANPNNPTGTIIPREDIMEVVATGVPVVVDEAYYEFSGETVAPLVAEYDNLVVLRTFSKWAGLAGLRIGYGIMPKRIAEYLLTIKPPYNVNVAALVAVKESLKDAKYLLGTVKDMISEREKLFEELSKLDFLKPYPSKANFILCAVLDGSAGEIRHKLQKKGILVRYYDTPLLKNCIRISVGKSEHTDIIMQALRRIKEKADG